MHSPIKRPDKVTVRSMTGCFSVQLEHHDRGERRRYHIKNVESRKQCGHSGVVLRDDASVKLARLTNEIQENLIRCF